MPAHAAPTRRGARREAQPQGDPRYRAATAQIETAAARLQRHAPPAQKAREASRSARAPANERRAGAQARVVDRVQQAPTPKPQPGSFKALLRAEIDKAMPRTLGETEAFMNPAQAGGLKQSLGGNVARQKAGAAGPVAQANQQAPDPAAVAAVPSTPLPAEPAPSAPRIDGAQAMPAPAGDAEVSLQPARQETAQRLADENIDTAQLQRAGDARFTAVVGAQAQVARHADSAPAAYRTREAAVLSVAQAQAAGLAGRGSLLLSGARGRGNGQVLARQQQQAAHEEAERQKVVRQVEALYARTRLRVAQRLAGLDAEVSVLFDQGVDAALEAMKAYVGARLRAYKFDRYLSIPGLGQARWIRDQFVGLPDEVNLFYAQGRRVFQSRMDTLIERVAALVEQRLAQAKAEVAAGQAEIQAFVGALPAHLRSAGQAAERALGERFAELGRSIDDKKNELAAGLAQKYKEAFDKSSQALQAMQEENKGLMQGFVEKLAAVVQALREFKARLMAAIRKGQATIDIIVADPGAFLGRLLEALKGGFNRFVDNIWTHLKSGFLAWMFGSLAAIGVALPPDFTLVSIFKLVLDVLGITPDRLRAKAVKLLGARAVAVVEKVVEYVKDLFTGGVARLWEHVKSDLADLKAMVVDAVQGWLVTTLIKQAVLKVVSMFNPLGAIVQVILTIVNVVMFVVEQAQRLLGLIEAVLNSVQAIATGAIGGAIAWIERALASAIPIVIGFLARLLGLSGLTEKIQEFIKKIQDRVDAAIDKVLARFVALARKLGGAVKAGAQKLIAWWKKKKPFSGRGEDHVLQFDGERAAARLMVHSHTPATPKAFARQAMPPPPPPGFVQAFDPGATLKDVDQVQGEIEALQGQLDKAQALQPPEDDKARDQHFKKIEAFNQALDAKFNRLGELLARTLNAGAGQGSEKNPLPIDYPKRRASAYPSIFVGPRSSKRVPQDDLKAVAGISPAADQKAALKKRVATLGKKELDAWTWGVQVFAPDKGATQRLPDSGGSVGLGDQFKALAPGALLMYDVRGKTGGGHKINNMFKPFGFVPRLESGESLDGDHVLERQLGGPDHLHNLWPLQARENRSSGSLVSSLKVRVSKTEELTVHELHEKRKPLYLLVKSTRESTA